MKTSNGLTIRRVKNPSPKKWPGIWFSFGRNHYWDGVVEYGRAHYSTLCAYIGEHAFAEVFAHYRSIPACKFSDGFKVSTFIR